MMNLEKLCERVARLSQKAGDYILVEMKASGNLGLEEKSENNFVTRVDRTSEMMLTEGLSALFPGSGFIAEEHTVKEEILEFTWVVDPLDGTTNFIHGVPLFCVSIGLMQGKELILGVIHEPNLGETFYAWRGGGAWLNAKRIRVSSTARIRDSLFATGFPYYDYGRLEQYLALFRQMMKHSRGLRRLGSAAADMAYTACGRYDGFYEYGLSPWDVAAGALLVREAGGMVSDFRGGDDFLFGREIVATNSLIFNDFIAFIGRFFPKVI